MTAQKIVCAVGAAVLTASAYFGAGWGVVRVAEHASEWTPAPWLQTVALVVALCAFAIVSVVIVAHVVCLAGYGLFMTWRALYTKCHAYWSARARRKR